MNDVLRRMDLTLIVVPLLVLAGIIYLVNALHASVPLDMRKVSSIEPIREPHYTYERHSSITTLAERNFYHRLVKICENKYLVLPQIHLSSLAVNKTNGRHHKAEFQRINRGSIDFILADRQTLAPVYAVELDDRTHDTEKARAIDKLREDILKKVGIPLARFRNVKNLSDQQIVERFQKALQNNRYN